MSISIKADSLGKRYRLLRDARAAQSGGPLRRSDTLVGEIAGTAAAFVQRLRGRPSGAGNQDFWALRNASFQIAPGEAVGLIGRNGSGKSTLLKILSQVTEPTEGSVRLSGRIASLLEVGTGFHPDLSARQNIFLNGAILGMRQREISARLDQIIDFAGIEQFLGEPVKHLSSGLYLRLAFAVAAYLESEILLVDEVLAVGDAGFQKKCLGTLQEAASGGRTVIFVSHNMAAVAHLTRRTIVLEQGQIAFDGATPDAVNYYIGEKRQQAFAGCVATDQLVCQRRHRMGDHVFIREMGLATSQAAEIEPGGSLRMEFLIQARGPCDGLRLGYTINSATGQALITGLSLPFSLPGGAQRLELVIEQVDLIPGDYDFSINLGIGDWEAIKLEYDSYMGFGRLSVVNARHDGSMFGPWHGEWGPVFHRHSRIQSLVSAS